MTELNRRTLLSASVLLPMVSAAACAEAAQTSPRPGNGSGTVVAYFSRSGNTRVIAGTIQRALGADLFEIRVADPYPDDYEQTVARATRERDRNYEPPLTGQVPNFATYDTVYLGFPIWGGTAPPAIRSFLRAQDLSGKTLRPFITHGGYGVGSSRAVLTAHAPSVPIVEPFVMEADQERRTMTQVKEWLGETVA